MNTLPNRFVQKMVDLYGNDGINWLRRLPDIITEFERRWSLTVLPPFENLSYNYIAPAIRTDGMEVILKIGVPNPELTTEIEALLIYDGRGIARLLEVDRDQGALLLERLRPGRMLTSVSDDEEATHIAAQVMQQLWQTVPSDHPFPSVAKWALGLDRMRNHYGGGTGPLPEDLVEMAEELSSELIGSMGEPVLLHGDLHHENILSATRQPWLAIDPKGVVGEREYEVGPLMYNIVPHLLESPRPSQILRRRVEILAAELNLDRNRLLGWGLARSVLSAWWCIEDHGKGWEWPIYCARLVSEVMD